MQNAAAGAISSCVAFPETVQAIEVFAADYGVPSFFAIDATVSAVVRGKPGQIEIKVALANLDGIQIELIEPVGGDCTIYSEALAGREGFAIVLHHLAAIVTDRAEWDRRRAELMATGKVVLDGADGDNMAFVYTDERTVLGHHLEYSWWAPAFLAGLNQAIPHHVSR